MCFMSFNVYFFFFKQKTAYEMRISDWSSDVCSSDLVACGLWLVAGAAAAAGWLGVKRSAAAARHAWECSPSPVYGRRCPKSLPPRRRGRSEEHTSELQSLMRISYAVFCLKNTIHNKL